MTRRNSRIIRLLQHRHVVTRELAVLLYRMWADGTEFRREKVEGTA